MGSRQQLKEVQDQIEELTTKVDCQKADLEHLKDDSWDHMKSHESLRVSLDEAKSAVAVLTDKVDKLQNTMDKLLATLNPKASIQHKRRRSSSSSDSASTSSSDEPEETMEPWIKRRRV